jgi:hypothetical protein
VLVHAVTGGRNIIVRFFFLEKIFIVWCVLVSPEGFRAEKKALELFTRSIPEWFDTPNLRASVPIGDGATDLLAASPPPGGVGVALAP